MFDFFKKKKIKNENTTPSALTRLKEGLSKTSRSMSSGIAGILTRRKLDSEALEDLEDLLITTDMGGPAAALICENLHNQRFEKDIGEDDLKALLAQMIEPMLEPLQKPLLIPSDRSGPYVIVMCGVNGSGKTTTMGKLAKQFREEGKSVVLAACDTFRAAAVDQLRVWAKRSGCVMIEGEPDADPSSVAYRAIEEAVEKNIDVVMIDTAGRLQNKKNLMEQLTKMMRVIEKKIPDAPHEKIVVLDGTTGQNAVSQVKLFNEAVSLTGMIMTKLDGTSKGGVLVNLAQSHPLPIYAIGVGEAIEDLQPFDAHHYTMSLVGLAQID